MGRFTMVLAVAALLGMAPGWAEDYLKGQAEVQALLQGATLHGTYLRTHSDYTLEFKADGTLVNPNGTTGRWWVNEAGQYCREWLTGQLAGNKACMEIARSGQGIAIFSQGRKVAEGELSRR